MSRPIPASVVRLRPTHYTCAMSIALRRQSLLVVAALVLAAAVHAACVPTEPTDVPPADEGTSPSIVFHGGRVITMEPDMPRAEAIAVRGEEIVAVGSSEQMLALAGPSTQLVDLQGRALLPGFIDAHTHLFSEAIRTGVPSLREVQTYALGLGITSMADMSVEPDVLAEIREFHDAGKMRIRTGVYPSYNLHCGEVLGHWYSEIPPERDPELMLRVLGAKVFTDGWTCDLLPAFSFELSDPPDEESARGHLIIGPDELARVLSELDDAGYQAVIHALGDRAVENALDAIESVLAGAPNHLRHRIEHNMFIRPELMGRYGEVGAVPVIWGSEACYIRNTSHRDSEGRPTHRWGGPESHPWINAWRSLLDANPDLPVAFHSDMSWGEPGPVAYLYSLTTRNEVFLEDFPICEAPDWLKEEAITVEEALRTMTTGAAYALHMEERVGSLSPGKLADLVVLSDDPLEVDAESLHRLEVLVTMVGGQVEHCARSAESLCPGIHGRRLGSQGPHCLSSALVPGDRKGQHAHGDDQPGGAEHVLDAAAALDQAAADGAGEHTHDEHGVGEADQRAVAVDPAKVCGDSQRRWQGGALRKPQQQEKHEQDRHAVRERQRLRAGRHEQPSADYQEAARHVVRQPAEQRLEHARDDRA